MSRFTNIPISTLHDKLRKFSNNIILKNTVILDYKKIGYDLRVNMLLKTNPENKTRFESFLRKSENVNCLYRVNNGFDYFADALFRDMTDFKQFIDNLDFFGVNIIKEFFVLEDLKCEGFLTDELLFRP